MGLPKAAWTRRGGSNAAAAEEVQGKVDEAVAALNKEESEEGAGDGYAATADEAALAAVLEAAAYLLAGKLRMSMMMETST